MIYKHLLYYWSGNRWIILILLDTFALKMVNLIFASLNSPSCMLLGTNGLWVFWFFFIKEFQIGVRHFFN